MTEIDDESREISGRALREDVLNSINKGFMHLNIIALNVGALVTVLVQQTAGFPLHNLRTSNHATEAFCRNAPPCRVPLC